MSAFSARLSTPFGGAHPALTARRARERMQLLVAAVITGALAMAVVIAIPKPSIAIVVAIPIAVVGLLTLLVSTRYEVTLTLVVLYLGLLDGPVKLETASQGASAIRDVLIFAVAIGMLVRMAVNRQTVSLPPLSRWVLGFAAVVVIQALNPNTNSFLKVLGGYRQELEWIPFFFFGYTLMRNKDNFRKLFLVLGFIALANGAVAVYQSRLSPSQLGSWGPGYEDRVSGTGGVSGRTYKVEGVSHPRPPALGSDSGFGGGVGVTALPGLMALLALAKRRRWLIALMSLGALAGVATAASRSSVIVMVVALISYAMLSFLGGIRVTRLFGALLAAAALAFGVGFALVSTEGQGIFARQESLPSVATTGSSGGEAKVDHLSQIPRDALAEPFGVGLGTGGSAGGFGGKQKVQIEDQATSAESAYNLLVLETGLPGLLLWIGLTVEVMMLASLGLRKVADLELRMYLVAVFSVFFAFTAEGFAGPTLAVSPAGTFLWFAPGVAAYWFVTRARAGNGVITEAPA